MWIRLQGGPLGNQKQTVSETDKLYEVRYEDSGKTDPDGLRIFAYQGRVVIVRVDEQPITPGEGPGY